MASAAEIEKRRRIVSSKENRALSNRELAKKLGVSEGIIRGDRKYLQKPESERPQRPEKVAKLYNPSNHVRHISWVRAAARRHLMKGPLTPDERLIALDKAWEWREHFVNHRWPKPSRTPQQLLDEEKGPHPETLNIYGYGSALGVWLVRCLPGDNEDQISILKYLEKLAQDDIRSREAKRRAKLPFNFRIAELVASLPRNGPSRTS